MTADGKIATANRQVSSFSSPRDKKHMLALRATADAVMSGARTVDLNSVYLGPGSAKYRRLRLKRGLAEYNLRIIVSGSGSIDPNAAIFKRRFSPIIILTTARAGERRLKKLRTLADDVKICGKSEINFPLAFRWLRQKWKVQRLLCEGGGELDDALFRAQVVNELHLTICPKIFGGRHAPTIADGLGAKSLSGATPLEPRSFHRHGMEIYLICGVTNASLEPVAKLRATCQ
jgi:riboflavin-specific deaminase-like protein